MSEETDKSISEILTKLSSVDTADCTDVTNTLVLGGKDVTDIDMTSEDLRKALQLPSEDNIADYRNLRLVGMGGVGAVFSAEEPGLERPVALKILRPKFRVQKDRVHAFIREARATAQIDHPNIVPVHRLGVFDDAGVYFSMKLLEGETLRVILKKLSENAPNYRRRYTRTRLLEIFLSVCNGVAFAHKHGIIHGDLKPGNIMVGDYGEVMVMDWGLANYLPDLDQGYDHQKMKLDFLDGSFANSHQEDIKDTLKNTQNKEGSQDESSHQIGGTPVFMPPELITRQIKEQNVRSEIYALGTILYTILTWTSAPFDTNLPQEEILKKVVQGKFVLPRRAAPREQPLSRELEAICLKAMALDPAKRYENVEQLIDDVRNYIDDFPVSAYSSWPFYRMCKWIARHPVIPITLIVALFTFCGVHVYNKIMETNALVNKLRIAHYSQQQGKKAIIELYQLKNRSRSLDNEKFIQLTTRMSSSFGASLAFLSDLSSVAPEEMKKKVNVIADEIFKETIHCYLNLGYYSELLETVQYFRRRWGNIFLPSLTRNPELAQLAAKIESSNGFLIVTLPESKIKENWTLSILDDKSREVVINEFFTEFLAKDLPLKDSQKTFKLKMGIYQLKLQNKAGKVLYTPITINPAVESKFTLSLPDVIPLGCLIPGKEFYENRTTEGQLPTFCIDKYEVTFREYLEFWKSLTSIKEKNICRAWSTTNEGTWQPIWDDNCNLISPYTLDLPVTGITGKAAELYAKWRSKKSGFVVRLPSREEWRKAAYTTGQVDHVVERNNQSALLLDSSNRKKFPVGAPTNCFSKDVSVYGVYGLIGNVREYLQKEHGNELYGVAGGSHLTIAPSSCSRQYSSGVANDIGFRCVTEIPSVKR